MTDTWETLTSTAAFLPYDDIDTDTIIPQVELLAADRAGLAAGLFAPWRYTADRRERPEFVLNQAPYRRAQVLVAGRNFGCGSSREHAAWALAAFGVRCVLAASFGPIFHRNCLRSRIAALTVPAQTLDELRDALGPTAGPAPLRVELAAGRLTAGERSWPVEVSRAVHEYVVEGLDEVARSLRAEPQIAAYEHVHRVPPLSLGR
ncbi:3-isopropylmalate dehydratase small subunit [Streptomyces sp. 4F14]|uniref:3-isopropylmalate dehydratase small subunit n=1 Tax=Streptomyces sp. 4F14 TaxID=3394380 RepID=UPI003A83FF56